MNSVIYVCTDLRKAYEDNSLVGRVVDRLNTNVSEESFVKELCTNITHVKLPPNFNNQAFSRNMERVRRFGQGGAMLAPRTRRLMDFNYYNPLQKQMMAFGVAKSVQLLLRKRKKNIKNSCIVVYDACHVMNKEILCEIAKNSRYLVLLSKDLRGALNLRDYLTANYGVSPVVSNDVSFVLREADFIISSKGVDMDAAAPLWCLDNTYAPDVSHNLIINDVVFKTQWEEVQEVGPELLGALMGVMKVRDLEESINSSGIVLDKITFNKEVIV